MSSRQVNQIAAIIAVLLIVILFVLVSAGVIPALAGILLTVGIGMGVRFLRSR